MSFENLEIVGLPAAQPIGETVATTSEPNDSFAGNLEQSFLDPFRNDTVGAIAVLAVIVGLGYVGRKAVTSPRPWGESIRDFFRDRS